MMSDIHSPSTENLTDVSATETTANEIDHIDHEPISDPKIDKFLDFMKKSFMIDQQLQKLEEEKAHLFQTNKIAEDDDSTKDTQQFVQEASEELRQLGEDLHALRRIIKEEISLMKEKVELNNEHFNLMEEDNNNSDGDGDDDEDDNDDFYEDQQKLSSTLLTSATCLGIGSLIGGGVSALFDTNRVLSIGIGGALGAIIGYFGDS